MTLRGSERTSKRIFFAYLCFLMNDECFNHALMYFNIDMKIKEEHKIKDKNKVDRLRP
jgi:hypothetical protein